MAIESLKKFWKFLGEDSWASWGVSILLAFIVVKFIFFPGISFLLATPIPLVVVESGSLQHNLEKDYKAVSSDNYFHFNNVWTGQYNLCGQKYSEYESFNFDKYWNICGNWYDSRGFTKEQFEKMPFSNGLYIGDIIVVWGHSQPEIGDIIIFNANQIHPVIHRVIDIKEINGEKLYSTKGDHNDDQIYFEGAIPKNSVIGKALFRVPFLGWIKLWSVDFINWITGNGWTHR